MECKECTCDETGNIIFNITINIEGGVNYEDQCTYVEHVYMDEGEDMDVDFSLD